MPTNIASMPTVPCDPNGLPLIRMPVSTGPVWRGVVTPDDHGDPAAEMTEEEWVAIHGEVDPYRFMTPAQFAAAMDATEDEVVEGQVAA